MIEEMSQRSLRLGARLIVARNLDVRIEGLEHLPRTGPALLACRHAHHLYDGCVLLGCLPRPIQMLVALDWVASPRGRKVMERACGLARWPVVLRSERLQPGHATASAYTAAEGGRYLRRAVRDALTLLQEGRILAVFPEAYPTIDPRATPKADQEAFLPFRTGVVRLAEMAQRGGSAPVPIVPVGLAYRSGRRWQATLRFGRPVTITSRMDRTCVLGAVEAAVRQLSTPAPGARYAGRVMEGVARRG
jgi:1-acyl-sn-glycerol-3-phosphate acyltransferase